MGDPFDCMKCRMQAETNPTGFLQASKLMLKEEGIRGFYRGIGAQLCCTPAFYMMFFGAYESYQGITKRIGWQPVSEEVSVTHSLVGGGFSGVFAWSTTYPLDLINTRMKTDPKAGRGFLGTARKVYRTYGLRGFYHGWTPCVLRSFPALAVQMYVVERTKAMLDE